MEISAHRIPLSPRRTLPGRAALLTGALASAIWVTAASARPVPQDVAGPSDSKPDVFHPDNAGGDNAVTPGYGGRVIVHLSSLPESLNFTIENSAVNRWMHYEIHEGLFRQDWETWEINPVLCESYVREDQVVLEPEAAEGYGDAVIRYETAGEEGSPGQAVVAIYGSITETEGGVTVRPESKDSSLGAPVVVPRDHIERIERGSVVTMSLRDDALWHDGHPFDAHDVSFTLGLYSNPEVDCDEKRFQYARIRVCETPDDRSVRVVFEQQLYSTMKDLSELCLVPAHIYDLSDEANPAHNPQATPTQQAEHVNENPTNHLWVGLGPYRVTAFNQEYIEAVRFDDYFDPDNGGYVETIRWRHIADDQTAFQALINGELDWFDRVKSEDYFGGATAAETFTGDFYKGYFYTGTYGFTGWNMYRPHLKEDVVRRALAHAFDFEEYKRTNYKGLCNQVTGPAPFFSMGYDHDVDPFPYDLDLAEEMLAEAGWYDRDGDDIIDKDGVPMVIKFMMPSGNDASTNFGLKYQESLAKIGVKFDIVQFEWATFLEKIRNRDFDCCNLAWVPTLEPDPEQIWHSKWGEFEKRGSNLAGMMDPKVDALIESIQRELDVEKRMSMRKELHRYLYERQPYLFMYNVPRKFACNKDIRGVELVKIPPGYIIRRWHYPVGVKGAVAERPQRGR